MQHFRSMSGLHSQATHKERSVSQQNNNQSQQSSQPNLNQPNPNQRLNQLPQSLGKTKSIYDEYDFMRDVNDLLIEEDIHSYAEAYAHIKLHLDKFWMELIRGDSSIHKHTMAMELLHIAALCRDAIMDMKLK